MIIKLYKGTDYKEEAHDALRGGLSGGTAKVSTIGDREGIELEWDASLSYDRTARFMNYIVSSLEELG